MGGDGSGSKLKPAPSWRGERGTTTERGYGWAWQKLRLRILERDGGRCVLCARKGRDVVARHVDHIKPKAKGGTDAESNLQSLCVACHEAKTLVDAGSRPRPVIGADGWPKT